MISRLRGLIYSVQCLTKFKSFLLRFGRGGKFIYRSLSVVNSGVRLIFDGRFRSETYYKFKNNRIHHQISTYTISDRYPLLFSECSKYFLQFRKNTTPKILSFGCSTGEEVFSLGEYMPSAKIIGIDANQWCINQCNKKNNNPKFAFYNRSSKTFADIRDCDAIFCMAVLQNTINRTAVDNRIAISYTFSKFENEIVLLDKKLKVGGLFIIDLADYSFTDTACADSYKPLPFEGNEMSNDRPLFDKNNRKISESQLNHRIFVKIK